MHGHFSWSTFGLHPVSGPTSTRDVFRPTTVGQDPCDSKSNRLHIDILRFSMLSFIWCTFYRFLSNDRQSPTSTGYFSHSTGSSATNRRFFLDIVPNSFRKIHSLRTRTVEMWASDMGRLRGQGWKEVNKLTNGPSSNCKSVEKYVRTDGDIYTSY